MPLERVLREASSVLKQEARVNTFNTSNDKAPTFLVLTLLLLYTGILLIEKPELVDQDDQLDQFSRSTLEYTAFSELTF